MRKKNQTGKNHKCAHTQTHLNVIKVFVLLFLFLRLTPFRLFGRTFLEMKREKWVVLSHLWTETKCWIYLDDNRICGWLCGKLETLIAFFCSPSILLLLFVVVHALQSFDRHRYSSPSKLVSGKWKISFCFIHWMTVKLKAQKIIFNSIPSPLALTFQRHYLWIVIIDNEKLLLCTIWCLFLYFGLFPIYFLSSLPVVNWQRCIWLS